MNNTKRRLPGTAISKAKSKEFLHLATTHYYLPLATVAEFLGVSEHTVRTWIKEGVIIGTRLHSTSWNVSVASLRNYMIRREMFVPGFNCPDLPDWSPEKYDVIPRDAALDDLDENQSAAVLLKIAHVFNDKTDKSCKRKLKEIVATINRSLTVVALHKRKKISDE